MIEFDQRFKAKHLFQTKNMLKMNKTLKSVFKYLIEIVIVAFGVFLGVYYSNIDSAKKTKKDKEKSLSLIISELKLNQELLQEQILYHESIRVQMDSIVPTISEEQLNATLTQTQFEKMEIKGWNGINFARLQKIAFESAKTTGVIREFDIELIQKLSKVYYFHDDYVDFGTSLLNNTIKINSSMRISDFFGTIHLMTTDLLGLEKRLSETLENTLTELKMQQENIDANQ